MELSPQHAYKYTDTKSWARATEVGVVMNVLFDAIAFVIGQFEILIVVLVSSKRKLAIVLI